jgi:tetratricopeptide (TPR) repeat protein
MSEHSQGGKSCLDVAVLSFAGDGVVSVTRAKLDAFLKETQNLELPAAERLRKLAIALEGRQFENGWDDLRMIYAAAVEADPHDANLFHSWGISALDWFGDWNTPKMADRVAIAAEVEQVLARALELAPQSSSIAYTLGLVYYNYPSRLEDRASYTAKAIPWFRKSLEWDVNNEMAQLYLAHCYHDEKDWGRAIEAHEKVDQERLVREWPHRRWRAIKCREQSAACYAWNGDTDEAVRRFARLLDELESIDEQTAEEAIANVDELVEAITRKLNHPELLRRTRALVKRLAVKQPWYEKRYQAFFTEEQSWTDANSWPRPR